MNETPMIINASTKPVDIESILKACSGTSLEMLDKQLDRMAKHATHSRDIAFGRLVDILKMIVGHPRQGEKR
jgi:hypothetical protein